MKFEATPIAGVYLVSLTPFGDDRGSFARAFCQKEFAEHGLDGNFVQANSSISRYKGTIRGLHYQAEPYGEDKLVRCIRGAIFDVALDLRPDSPTYKQWYGIELVAGDGRMLYVPKGCAHGCQSLVEDTEIFYPTTQFYTPQAERGVRWNDPAFRIAWPIMQDVVLSDKDQAWADYIELSQNPATTAQAVV